MKIADLREEIVEEWKTGDYPSYVALGDYIISKYGDLGIKRDSVARAVERYVKSDILEPIRESTRSTVSTLLEELNKEKRKNLKIRDQRNRDNRLWRKSSRNINTLEELYKEFNLLLSDYGIEVSNRVNYDPQFIEGGGVGVLAFSDLHGNEIVDTDYNKYDFKILAKRMKKYVSYSLEYFSMMGIEEVIILSLGDQMNSDRRKDELFALATNRSKALFLMIHLFTQAILDVAQYYPVKVYGVLGNESRMNDELSYHEMGISDNFDFIIMEGCKIALQSTDLDIEFGPLDKMQQTITVGNQRWLICHDINSTTSTQKNSQAVLGKMTILKDPAEFVIGGHKHSYNGTDFSFFVGSMVGGNDYSMNGIEMATKASGTCIVVKNDERYMNYIDLDNYEDDGYMIDDMLEEYKVKSIS